MKILFTASKNPNLFSRAISIFEKSKFSHVLIETDLYIPGTKDPLCFQSSWNSGFNLTPKSIAVGDKIAEEYEDGLALDWRFIRKLLAQFGGAQNYGWPQAAGRVLRYFKIKEPKWLFSNYAKSAYCSKLILLMWAKGNFPCNLDLNLSGPEDLRVFLKNRKL